MQTEAATQTEPYAYGLIGAILGIIGIGIVILQFTVGPFAPQAELGVSLGELGSEIGKSALRDMFGVKQPEPTTRPWDIDATVKVIAIACGLLALCAAIASFLRKERRGIIFFSAGLGVSAILFQFFVQAFLILICVLVIAAFFNSFGDIFG